MIEYYRDGSIQGERLFEHDVEVGKSTFYYPNGVIKEVQYYDQGKMNGGDTVFYDTGKIQFLRNWDHGLLDGYIRKWDQQGVMRYEAKYAKNVLVEVKGQSLKPDSLQIK